MTGAATVAYDPAVTSPERLVESIRGTGYGAELPLRDASIEEMTGAEDAREIASDASCGASSP